MNYQKSTANFPLGSVGPQFHSLGELGDMERNFQALFYPANVLAASGLGNSTNEG